MSKKLVNGKSADKADYFDFKIEASTMNIKTNGVKFVELKRLVLGESKTDIEDFKVTSKKVVVKNKKELAKPNLKPISETLDVKKIVSLDCKKHIKMFKLSRIGMPQKEIAGLLNTNVGHVWNELNRYKDNDKRVNAANAI